MENWLPVSGYEGLYEVSDRGRVKRLAGSPRCIRDRILKPALPYGYETVCLCQDSRSRHFSVSRLVLSAFIGPCPPGHNCNHKNGVKRDNFVANLEWVTFARNLQHALETGLRIPHGCPGEKNGMAKITAETASLIKARLWSGEKPYAIARSLGLEPHIVYNILLRSSWSQVPWPEGCSGPEAAQARALRRPCRDESLQSPAGLP